MLFALEVDYTAEAMSALIRNPVDRSKALAKMVEGTPTKVVGWYATSGGDKLGALIIYDVADEMTFTAILDVARASAAFSSIRSTRLLTGEEARQGLIQAQEVQKLYQPPK